MLLCTYLISSGILYTGCQSTKSTAFSPPTATTGSIPSHSIPRADLDLKKIEDLTDLSTQEFLANESQLASRMLTQISGIRSELQQELSEQSSITLQSTECSTAIEFGEFSYVTCQDRGRPQPLLYRIGSEKRELVIDFNELGPDPQRLAITGVRIAPDNSNIAYAVRSDSHVISGLYRLNIDNKDAQQVTANTTQRFEWGNHGELFFVLENSAGYEELLRLRGDQQSPERLLVNRQADARFELKRSRDSSFLVVTQRSAKESSVYLINLENAQGYPRLAIPMQAGRMIDLDSNRSTLFIRSNEQHKNFALYTAPLNLPVEKYKAVYTPQDQHSLGVFFPLNDSVLVFDEYGWQDTINRISLDGKVLATFSPDSKPMMLRASPLFQASDLQLRITAVSPCGNEKIYSLDPHTLIENAQVSTEPDDVRCNYQEITVPVSDGVRIPVSIITAKDPKAILLVVYGAYGTRPQPMLSSSRRALLRHGVSIVQPQIRGGGFYGSIWHEAGVGERKGQSLDDLLEVIQALAQLNRPDTQKFFAYGRSAGGTLVASAAMLRPDLLSGAILEMPFLDVTRTLLDTSQPLAVRDRSEWGDVRYSKQREQIEKISPMNIDTPIVMPPMLIITSYLDEIVPYWHSAKWVAKQRQSNPSSARNITLLIEEDSSHTESRDQFLAQERENIEAAFIIHLLNE